MAQQFFARSVCLKPSMIGLNLFRGQLEKKGKRVLCVKSRKRAISLTQYQWHELMPWERMNSIIVDKNGKMAKAKVLRSLYDLVFCAIGTSRSIL